MSTKRREETEHIHCNSKTTSNETLPVLVTADEVASMLSISNATVHRHNTEGRLPEPIRIGRAIRWRLKDITAWIENGCHYRRDKRQEKSREK